MRLGQLARQLDIAPDKIVSFLGSREIAIDSSANARIDDAFVDLIVQHFAPGNETLRQQIQQQPEVAPSEDTPEEGSPAETAIPEVIKAPKIELPGLRVLGKIELPEKKKKEPEKAPEEAASTQENRARPISRNPRRQVAPRDRKNPIALAREREEQEKRKAEAEKRELEKQRRAEHYLKRLKPQPPTKAARLHREELLDTPATEPERPKTLWGRFMRWLND